MRTRILFTAASLTLAGGLLSAAGKGGFSFVSASEAERQVSSLAQYDTSAAMFIWADKYVYQPGETLTLRGTLRPNDDLYPYTIVAFRVNNQTGVKQFYGNNNASDTPIDIFGRAMGEFQVTRLPALNRTVLVGDGGIAVNRAFTIPNELGMHTIVVQLRDFTGTRVVKSAYFKIGVVDGFDDIAANITASRRLVNTRAYRLRGTVFVTAGTLEIEPGTFIIGQPGSLPASALVVTRGARIAAAGTRARPIIMTSSRPFGQRERGDWGGLVLLGSAPTNWPTGTGVIEGLAQNPADQALGTYGGTDAAHSCGVLRYVRVEFAGAQVRPNDELNSITWGGCGLGTVSEYLQTSYGADDSFEWFGGNNEGKYLVSAYAKDDYIDWQIGWTGKIQHALALVGGGLGSNRGIEGDNNETGFDFSPRSAPQLYNLTFVGDPALPDDENNSIAGIWLRRGTGASINNTIVYNWNQTGIEVRDAPTAESIGRNELRSDGLLLWNNGRNLQKPNTFAGQVNSANTPAAVAAPFLEWVSGTRGTSRNNLVVDPMMRRPLDSSDPDFRPMLGSPLYRASAVQPPDNGFFDQWAQYIGAFGDMNWMEEWTNLVTEADIRGN